MNNALSDQAARPVPAGYDGDDPREVLSRVRSLAPVLRATAAAAEASREPLPENIRLLEQAGVYRLPLARHRGGMESSLDDRFDVLHEIARVDPSLAWVTGIHLDGIWIAGTYSDEVQEEIFDKPDARVCGVFMPTGTGVRVEGGLIVSGKWDFNTGWRYADWLSMTVMVENADGTRAPHIAVMRQSETRSLNNWDAMGMTGTGSHTTIAEAVFVPARRATRLGDDSHNMSVRNHDNRYFQIPILQYIAAGITGSIVGTAQGAMDEFLRRLPGRKIMHTDYSDQSEAPVTHIQLGRAQLDIEAAEMFARKSNALVQSYAGREMPIEARVRTRAYLGQLTENCRRAIQILFEASGATVIQSSVALQRFFRDGMAVSQHALLSPITAQELYGRVLLGKPPNSRYL
jgi:3-hydroxy-9,10-secoandrosta-1,3,5(10)-triene-9,17-dione monooxygenase